MLLGYSVVIIVHPSSTRARTCFWAKRSWFYPRWRGKIDEHISVKVKKSKRNNWIDLLNLFISWRSSVEKIIHYFRKTTSWIWTSNVYTTSEKIYNYSGKCATLIHKIGEWFLSHELLRKTKKIESTIVGLQESSRRYDRDFEIFPLLRQF